MFDPCPAPIHVVNHVAQGRQGMVWQWMHLDGHTLLGLAESLRHADLLCDPLTPGRQAPWLILDSVEPADRYGRCGMVVGAPLLTWVLRDQHARISHAGGPDQEITLNALAPALKDLLLPPSHIMPLPPSIPAVVSGIFGNLGFDTMNLIENVGTSPRHADAPDLPDAVFLRPGLVVVVDIIRNTVLIACAARRQTNRSDATREVDRALSLLDRAIQACRKGVSSLPASPVSFDRTWHDALLSGSISVNRITPPDDYHAIIAKAQRYIKAGDVFQVVLSQRFIRPLKTNAFTFYRTLRLINPSPYSFFMQVPALDSNPPYALVGASPEMLVRVETQNDNQAARPRVLIRPIAGTRPRGQNDAHDARLAKELQTDPKEVAEHMMLLDLARNDVGRVAQISSLSVEQDREIELYSHVMHMCSLIQGRLRSDSHAIDAVLSGFPAGTVSGAPKIRAVQIIHELERDKRGFYAGCVGYFTDAGTADTCITLRTAAVVNGLVHLRAGGGVVADSTPEGEDAECQAKLEALVRAAALADAWHQVSH